VFSGRAQRKEYWWFVLVNCIIVLVLGLLIDAGADQGMQRRLEELALLYGLAIVVPFLAATIRRLHDTNHSGWWLLAAIVLPLVGFLLILAWTATEGDIHGNQYGHNPRQAPPEVRRALPA
jgi:uncharacterized membrane protein YhaH (DUF805 family)